MGFLGSSCSFTRFRVIDPVPDELWAEIPQLLKKGAILDIDETTDSQADGWVSFDDYLDTTWQAGPPQKGAYMAFSLRLDIRRIPAGVVRKYLDLALKREKAENEKNGKKFISRERRKELKEPGAAFPAQALPARSRRVQRHLEHREQRNLVRLHADKNARALCPALSRHLQAAH